MTFSSSGSVGIGTSTVNINPITFRWNNEEFVNCFPDFDRIEAMCKEYPGLKIALEKFATTYRLVKDEYDNPKDKK